MKLSLNILKYLLLAVLVVAIGFGYLFFRVWQKNERPTITSLKWNQPEVTLAHGVQLTVKITAPWHREISTASPTSLPPALTPLPNQGKIKRGKLQLNGKRNWTLTIPIVTTKPEQIEGEAITFPIKSTKRISPNYTSASLPALKINLPEEIPNYPNTPSDFLGEQPPPPPPEESPSSAPESRGLSAWWFALVPVAGLITFFLLRRFGIIKTTPAWVKALEKLDNLKTESPPKVFYSALTDILKEYVSGRYSVRARTKTTSEFLETIQEFSDIPAQQLQNLPQFAHLADEVKFADLIPDSENAPKSIDLIRSFINSTTPDPKTKKQS